jgi:CHAT domain-containing protein
MALLLAQGGSRAPLFSKQEGKFAEAQGSPAFREAVAKTGDLVKASRYREAAEIYEKLYNQALTEGNPAGAIRMLNNLAGMRQSLFAYQEALRAYLQAKELSIQTGRKEVLPVLDANISTVYGTMGNFSEAIPLGEAALPQLTGKLQIYRSALLSNLAVAYWRTKNPGKATQYLREAAQDAESTGNTRMQALAYDRLGDIALDESQTTQAEEYYFEAFRIRRLLVANDLPLSYPRLGKVKAAGGKDADARRFFDLAVSSHRSDPKSFPLYSTLTSRGNLKEKTGDFDGALEDYRTALAAVRSQRIDLVPVGAMQATWEGSLQDLRSSFIRLSAERAIRTHDSELALESLVAAEEARLASLRSSDGIPKWQTRLPADYRPKIVALQRAEAATNPDPTVLAKLRLELVEMESRAGLSAGWVALPAQPMVLARHVRDNLPPYAAIISFHLGEPASYVWFVTRGRVDLVRLSAGPTIARAVTKFRDALDRDTDNIAVAGKEVYAQIFREIPPVAASKSFWTIVSDDRLFDLPFAALSVGGSPGGQYLVEKHVIREAPSALLQASKQLRQPGLFVGVGDAIYNSADERIRRKSARPAVELPRLFSSGTEIDRCARAWAGRTQVFKGPEINFTSAVSQSPAVLHFAAHFVRSTGHRERAMMSLGLAAPTYEQQLVGADQIAALTLNGGVVTMSGCHSGAGETIRGAGLMGLTRSWLIAGAQAVTGTYWPTPDDSGELFVHFYQAYSRQTGTEAEAAAIALQQAQVAMIRSGGWRRSPRYWGAYFLMTKG